MKLLFLILSLFSACHCGIFYDSFYGNVIDKEELKRHDKANSTFWCTIEIEPCDPNEGRRVDGSCNNLDNPVRGISHTPFRRLLPPVFDKVDDPRKSKSGKDLPLARRVRTSLLSEGRVTSQVFTQLASHFLVFMSADIISQHDTINYVLWKPYCCLPKGKKDRDCVPNEIPDEDPVHRFSGVRCLNMTRPQTYQGFGCIKEKDTVPERIGKRLTTDCPMVSNAAVLDGARLPIKTVSPNIVLDTDNTDPIVLDIVTSTPLFDLSTVYGISDKVLSQKSRLKEGGLLKFEVTGGKIWPPSAKSKGNICLLNELPRETRCHDGPDDGMNTLGGTNLLTIWFWRLHNLIATELAKINPCWDDDKLFNTARDLNIAAAIQIYYYEMLPLLLGADNLANDGVTEPTLGYRDIYNSSVFPQMSLEYPYALRYIHLMQDWAASMYDTEGNHLKNYPLMNLTLKTGFFAVDEHMEQITQGSFRQGGAAVDYIVDPDVSELGLGPHQHVTDITTNDLAKARYFGFQPYIKYRELCSKKPVTSYEDLADVIDPERIEMLKDLYEDISDIDLMAGMWVERPIQGGHAPPTFYCIVVDQLNRNIVSDRHWYERKNRPNALTEVIRKKCTSLASRVRASTNGIMKLIASRPDCHYMNRCDMVHVNRVSGILVSFALVLLSTNTNQLREVRKITMARMLCDIGDSVTKIQPQAFKIIGPGNKLTSCDDITKIDISVWKDPTCEKNS